MSQTPNPISLTSVGARSTSAGDHRDVHCPKVNAYVDTAFRKGWDGFSCKKCPLFGTHGAKGEE